MFVDIHMTSPSSGGDGLGPSFDELQGSSKTVGGHIRGHALGNVFNIGDGHEDPQSSSTQKGKVHLFTDIGAYDRGEQSRKITIPVNSTLKPILQDIAKKWPPIASTYSCFLFHAKFNICRGKSIHLCFGRWGMDH
jgi:hypothetical protein